MLRELSMLALITCASVGHAATARAAEQTLVAYCYASGATSTNVTALVVGTFKDQETCKAAAKQAQLQDVGTGPGALFHLELMCVADGK